MGCCASSEEPPVEAEDVEIEAEEIGESAVERAKNTLDIAESDATKAKPKGSSFVGSVLNARKKAADNADVMAECCTRLQAYNSRVKEYVAKYDCEAINEAMNGGFMGLGCNDNKLIAAVCTRTKSQLQRTKKAYRDKYDKDVREEVEGETGGAYRKLMYFILAAPDAYIADIIDMACNEASILEFGCDEIALLEVFVTHTQEELQAGKAKWEGRTDKHLVDFLKKNLGSSYRHLNRLLNLLFMGDRVEDDVTDEALAAEQVAALHEECEKGWFEDFDESMIIEIIGKNPTVQNALVAQEYEKAYGESLAKALKGKCGERLFYALNALLLTKANFLAMRLHDAMKGWGSNKNILTRLLGGLDGDSMAGVVEAFEEKYDQPLWSALKEEIDGDFLKAALTWMKAINEPRNSAEKVTEQDVADLDGDADKLADMVDHLLFEHEALMGFVSYLDVETIREATKGAGTEDTALIRAFATRNKRCLQAINLDYRAAYKENFQRLIERELLEEGDAAKNEWYAYLAKFLVVQEEQADAMILDLAMNGEDLDNTALTEFLCGRHPRRVRAAKNKWEQSNDDSLVDKLADNLSGDMSRLALKMLKGKRDTDDDVDEALGKKQAHQLHDGELDYIDVLGDNNYEQNKFLASAYEDAYDTSLKRAIKQEYSGPVKEALEALLTGPANWYAAQLKKALNGDEVNDKVVCRIVGGHDKDEIKEIAAAYDKKYGVTLKSDINRACKGNYKRLAVAWVDLADQLAQPDKLIQIPK